MHVMPVPELEWCEVFHICIKCDSRFIIAVAIILSVPFQNINHFYQNRQFWAKLIHFITVQSVIWMTLFMSSEQNFINRTKQFAKVFFVDNSVNEGLHRKRSAFYTRLRA